jgi:hypothetical protein
MTRTYAAAQLYAAALQLFSTLLPLLVAWWLFVLDDDDRAGYLEQLGETAARVRAHVPSLATSDDDWATSYGESPALAFARSRLDEMEREEEAQP